MQGREVAWAVAHVWRGIPASVKLFADPLPAPRVDVDVRQATLDDLPFIDQLQKMHSHMVGFLHKKTLEKYVEDGNVLLAVGCRPSAVGEGGHAAHAGARSAVAESREPTADSPLGYIIFRDQYLKRDDVGIIYQLNVLPIQQRNLIGASLVKATFERAAYGCKLFCCWCAQDIQASYFWESIGFTPIAFRTGSRAKQRIHIFWQKRIRPPEVDPGPTRDGEPCPGGTPWWYPYQTQNGAVAEDRIVLPIPPGTHWRDAKPVVLPASPAVPAGMTSDEPNALTGTLPGGAPVSPRPEESRVKLTAAQRAAIARMHSAHLGGVPLGKKAVLTSGGVKYVERSDFVPELDVPPELEELLDPDHAKKKAQEEAKAKRLRSRSGSRPRRVRGKHDLKYIAAARELRDRYLDAVNSGRLLVSATDAKYEVARQLEAAAGCDSTARRSRVPQDRLLDAA